MTRACLAQFEVGQIIEHLWPMARTSRAMEQVLEDIKSNPGLVVFTLVDNDLRDQLLSGCRKLGTPCVSVLDPIMQALGSYLDEQPGHRPGRQHAMDADYFRRIEAMDWVLAHDDGQGLDGLGSADVVLVGVSRTSKTPTCLYLGNRGVKAANIPYVPDITLPSQVFAIKGPSAPRIIALTNNPKRLVEIRRSRLMSLSQEEPTAYVDPEQVKAETIAARKLYLKMKWPIIDVSHRSIEETASAILQILNEAAANEGE